MATHQISIEGLHLQIKSNAVVLYPIGDKHLPPAQAGLATQKIEKVTTTDSFQVTVQYHGGGLIVTGYDAYLTYFDGARHRQLAFSTFKDSVMDALQGLLDTTARALGAKSDVEAENDMDKENEWRDLKDGFVDAVVMR